MGAGRDAQYGAYGQASGQGYGAGGYAAAQSQSYNAGYNQYGYAGAQNGPNGQSAGFGKLG